MITDRSRHLFLLFRYVTTKFLFQGEYTQAGMYLLFKSEQSANFFYELYKRARKWSGIPTGITQNVDDLLRSELARTMLSNTQFVVMLSQNATDREQLSGFLNISLETMMYVTDASPGSGLIFADEFGTIPFENKIPSNTNTSEINES